MPLVDDGFLIPGNAFVYVAAAGTAKPTPGDLDSPTGYTLLGHLGLDDGTGMPSFEFEGGEVSAKGSMSKKTVRTTVSKIVRGATFSLSQFTRECLTYYYGGTGGIVDGYFDVLAADDGVPKRSAILFTFLDGDEWFGWWAGVCDTIGADALSTEDVENALLLPLRTTVLDSASPLTVPKFSWIASTILDIP